MPTFSTYDGTRLAYHLRGEGEPLICLAGGPMRASAYLGDLGGLAAHRRLILLDPRGTGDSAEPADPATYRCGRQVADVEALREHLGLERIDLLGHSASGTLAVLYAAAHPERIATLTVVTGGTRAVGIRASEQDWRDATALRAGEPWYEAGRAAFEEVWAGRDMAEVVDLITPFVYGRWDANAHAHAATADEQINWAASAAYFADGALPDPAATRAALAAVTAPVLVYAGEYDGGPTPARAAELATLFPHGEVAVQRRAGHYPWVDDPGAFSRTVAAFLDPAVRSRIPYRT
ncbi:alpha/beta hydrolase [Streptomyces sp. CB03238]|uniref:alpha/beta fold hydrolase n=1 Tax=Streptomyces sp. CB03238 TaxID=1907777 RepID=UPI000A1183AA|nr:alpha/beta hydrolase [Streptomyces sp. CB03238]